MTKNKAKRSDKPLYIILGVYFVLLLAVIFTNKYVFFDEAVYIGMSKYIYSFGSQGFFEHTRPLVLPIIIGIPLFFGIGNWYFAKILIVVLSVSNIFLLFKIAEKLSNKKIAYLTILLFLTSEIYIICSTKILPHIPAIFFMLLTIHFFMKKKLWLCGLFAGLAFLTRFPYGLLLVGVVLAIWFSSPKMGKKTIIANIVGSLKFVFAFLAAALPYLVFNYLRNINEPIGFLAKVAKPFLQASQTIAESNAIFGKPFFWYFTEFFQQNFLIIFGIIGIYVFISKYKLKERNTSLIIFVFALMAGYFSITVHKELRYGLSFLPFIFLFTSIGVFWVIEKISLNAKNQKKDVLALAWIIGIVCLLAFFPFIFVLNPVPVVNENDGLVSVLSQTNLKIISSSPMIALYTDNKIMPIYYSLEKIVGEFSREKQADLLVLDPNLWDFTCSTPECTIKNKYFISNLFKKYRPVFYGKINNEDLIILSKNEGIDILGEDRLSQLYKNYANTISISDSPKSQQGIILFRIDAVGDIDENNELINKENIVKLNDIFIKNNIPVTWAIIPKSFSSLKLEDKRFFLEYYSNNKGFIEISQNGYSFKNNALLSDLSEFAGIPKKEQFAIIEKGKIILEQEFNISIITFVAPFSKTDRNTLTVLEELGFKVYSSAKWELVDEVEGLRYFHANMYLLKDVGAMQYKSSEELVEEFEAVSLVSPYTLLQFQTNNLGEKEISALQEFVLYLQNTGVSFMSISQLSEWQDFLGSLEFKHNSKQILLQKRDSEFNNQQSISLLFSSSGDYEVKTDFEEINAINVAPFPIELCLNQECKKIESGNEAPFVFSTSQKAN